MTKKYITGLLLTSFLLAPSAFAETIRSIEITGNKRIESETVLSYIPLKAGSSYDQVTIDQALKDLYATGYFSDVQIKHHQGTIVVDIIENAIINKVAFEGNDKIKDDKLQEEVQLRPREVLSRTKIQAAQQRILDLYRRMGRYGATVEPKIIKLDENRVDLVFEINEGEVTYVRKVNFIGNKHIDSDKLEKILLTKRTRWYRFFAADDTYDPERFVADQHFLRQYYYDNGYPDFRIVSAVAELSVDQKDLYLTFTIEEGERYTFDKVTVKSDIKRLPPEALKGKINFSAGDWYSGRNIEKSMTDMTEAASAAGFAFAQVDPIIEKNREKKTVDITFEIKEGPRVYVERVEIRGNDRTKDAVIRREIRLHEGDAYNSVYVKRAEQNLNDLGYFKKVEIVTEPGSAPDKAKIIIKVEEQPTGELGIAGGFSSLDRALGNVHFTERNLMGTGRSVSIDATIASRRQDFDIGISDPYFLGYNLEGGANIFHTRSTRLSHFTQESTGTRLHVGYTLAENWYQTLSYGLRQDKLLDVPDIASLYLKQQAGKYLDSSIAQALTYDRRNSRREPTAGYNVTLSNSYSGLGGNVNYLKNSLGASAYYTPIEEVTINARATIGNVNRVSSKPVRLVDSIFLGNESFRGFSYGGLGPRDARTNDPLGGTLYWVTSLEAMFPIGLPNEFGVKGAVFTDIGSVWKTAQNMPGVSVNDSKSARISVGVGIAWKSPLGPLRLDYAIPLKKQSFDQPERFLFGVSSRF
ncbi:outer membrane protein assembly factor BamA [Candidatus Paracaedibacter symbiosus]|uniref:outer membrane protein assembly factor BamA n=1 Tax=Candidatus Paracaedibacter symbiosus TaxID=244582 RepID=UPI000509DD95|nr:outer membrane protein assembly factor BamA [Candidatus Paracaedibacter symbiosus]